MRFIYALTSIIFVSVMPVVAQAEAVIAPSITITSAKMSSVVESPLPLFMRTALLDAAETGNPLVLEAVADRLAGIFPENRHAIQAYVTDMARPASTIMAVIDEMIHHSTPPSMAYLQGQAVFYPERVPKQAMTDQAMTDDALAAAALAAELNDMDVGVGL